MSRVTISIPYKLKEELKRLGLKGEINNESLDTLFEAIEGICHMVWLNDTGIFTSGTSFFHGTGIPTVDSIILASFLANNIFPLKYTTKSTKYNFSCRNFRLNFPPKNTTFGVLTN